MKVDSRLARIEDSPQLRELEKERKQLRIMQLIAIGTLRLRGLAVVSVSQFSESELLGIIGTDKQAYEKALFGFIAQRKREVRA